MSNPHQIGGGSPHDITVITSGYVRQRVSGTDAHFWTEYANADPINEGSPVYYFRISGGKGQLCVRFPTGPVQILATEP